MREIVTFLFGNLDPALLEEISGIEINIKY